MRCRFPQDTCSRPNPSRGPSTCQPLALERARPRAQKPPAALRLRRASCPSVICNLQFSIPNLQFPGPRLRPSSEPFPGSERRGLTGCGGLGLTAFLRCCVGESGSGARTAVSARTRLSALPLPAPAHPRDRRLPRASVRADLCRPQKSKSVRAATKGRLRESLLIAGRTPRLFVVPASAGPTFKCCGAGICRASGRLKPGLVRLGRNAHRRVRVPLRRSFPPVTESNCVLATGRGEQLEVNGRSVELRDNLAPRHELDSASCD